MSRGFNLNRMCAVLEIPFLELLNFLNQDRLHMQQGMFPNLQQLKSTYDTSFEMDYDTYMALMGVNLKQKDFLKIDQTCLADVIFEEPEYQHVCQQAKEEKCKQPNVTTGKKKGKCNFN